MVFDLQMISGVYDRYEARVNAARQLLNRPLTLTEKILYTHLSEGMPSAAYERGQACQFRSGPRYMQDATAQMALLQFMSAGKAKVAVPSTVHCDHLIQAKPELIQTCHSAGYQ